MLSTAALTARANRNGFTSVERVSFIGIFLCFAALFSAFDVKAQATAGIILCACLPLGRRPLFEGTTPGTTKPRAERGPNGSA
jgi:hypothetical protein